MRDSDVISCAPRNWAGPLFPSPAPFLSHSQIQSPSCPNFCSQLPNRCVSVVSARSCLMSAVVVHWMSKEWHPANNPRKAQWTYNGYPTNTHKDNPSDNPVEIQWTSNEQSASNQSGGQSGEHLADILWIFGGHCWTYGGHLASFWQIQGFGIWKQVGNGTGFGTGTGTGRDLGMMIRYGLSVYLLKFTF